MKVVNEIELINSHTIISKSFEEAMNSENKIPTNGKKDAIINRELQNIFMKIML